MSAISKSEMIENLLNKIIFNAPLDKDRNLEKNYRHNDYLYSLINEVIKRPAEEFEKFNNLIDPKRDNLKDEIFKKVEKMKITTNPLLDKGNSDFGIDTFEELLKSREWRRFAFSHRVSITPTTIHEFALFLCFYGDTKTGNWSPDHAQEEIKRHRKITKEEVQQASIEDIQQLSPLQKLAIGDLLSEQQIRDFFLLGAEADWQHHLLKQPAGVKVQKDMYREAFSQGIPPELIDEANNIQRLLQEKHPLPKLNAAWEASVREQANLSDTCQRDPSKIRDWMAAHNVLADLSLEDKVVKGEFVKLLSVINEKLRPEEFNPYYAPSHAGNNYKLREGLKWVQIKSDTGQAFPAAPSIVAEMVEETREWFEGAMKHVREGSVNPILVASELYFRIVSIHPMEDGNGRTARTLMNKVLLDAGLIAPVLCDSDAACLTAKIGSGPSKHQGETKETVLKKVLAAYKKQLALQS